MPGDHREANWVYSLPRKGASSVYFVGVSQEGQGSGGLEDFRAGGGRSGIRRCTTKTLDQRKCATREGRIFKGCATETGKDEKKRDEREKRGWGMRMLNGR